MQLTRTIEEEYDVCDFCRKEIDVYDANIHIIRGDFDTVLFHREPCLRQAAVLGARTKNAV